MTDLTFGCRWVRPLPSSPGTWKKQLATKHLKQAESGNLPYIDSLLANDFDLLNKRGPHGRTFLFEAVRKGRKELVEWLLDKGADPNITGCVNSESMVQLSPLSACHFYQHQELEELLLSKGAEEDVFRLAYRGLGSQLFKRIDEQPGKLKDEDPHDTVYFTPLNSFAIAGNHLSLLGQLVDAGCLIEPYSFQLLFLACHFGNAEVLAFLLNRGATPKCADASLWMSTNDLNLLKILVDHGLSANQRPYHGLTPLLYTCRADKGLQLEKLRYLLDLGANVNTVSKDGRSALHYAAVLGNLKVCELLLEAGVDRSLKNDKGETAAQVATNRNHHELAAQLSL